jgi:hypothetical protein
MRVDLSEQRIPVDLSSRDEGGPFGTKMPVDLSSRDEENRPFGTKKIRWTSHHVVRVDLLAQKIPVGLSSRDEGGPFGTRISGGPVIT